MRWFTAPFENQRLETALKFILLKRSYLASSLLFDFYQICLSSLKPIAVKSILNYLFLLHIKYACPLFFVYIEKLMYYFLLGLLVI